MKKLFILLIFIPVSLSAKDFKFSLNSSYYNELLIKPGVTISPELSLDLNKKNQLGISLPSLTYFYFPESHHALYIYPEIFYNFTPKKHFFIGVSGGYGLALSKIIVPVYNISGELVEPETMIQSIMKAGLNLGYSSTNYDIYGSIGWKGLYPYNLTIKHQAYLQLGYRRYIYEKN